MALEKEKNVLPTSKKGCSPSGAQGRKGKRKIPATHTCSKERGGKRPFEYDAEEENLRPSERTKTSVSIGGGGKRAPFKFVKKEAALRRERKKKTGKKGETPTPKVEGRVHTFLKKERGGGGGKSQRGTNVFHQRREQSFFL